MAKRQTLGRGLSALFGDEASEEDGPAVAIADGPPDAAAAQGEAAPTDRRTTRAIAVDRLVPSPFQPRRHFDEDALDELADSLRDRGMLQPLLVRPSPGADGHFEIVAGERRWRAAQRAGLHEVPVLVRELDDRETLEVALVENLQRQDLNPMEEAEGYRRLSEEFNHGPEALATAVGKSRSHIANTLRLLNLPERVRTLVSDGALSAGHARALLSLENPTVFAEEVVRKGLNVRQTETLVREALQRPAQTRPRGSSRSRGSATDKDTDTLALERDLADRLGMTVSIDSRPNGGGGTVTVTWQSLSQLDEILARLSAGPSAVGDPDGLA